MVKVEIEVETLTQLHEAIQEHVDAVLLDNMDVDTIREAVRLSAGRVVTEASGSIRADTAQAIAATGVDLLSVGWITHSAPALDVALEVDV
jgi:nicotinate-nucleotide pyrophosphorylase (carboxylating)